MKYKFNINFIYLLIMFTEYFAITVVAYYVFLTFRGSREFGVPVPSREEKFAKKKFNRFFQILWRFIFTNTKKKKYNTLNIF